MSEPSGLRLIELLLTYLARAAPRMTEEALRHVGSMAGPQAEHIAMTLAEELHKRGVEEGVKRGVKQGIKRGVKQGVKRGVRQGVKVGVDRGKREMLAQLVRLRFGRLPRWAAERLRGATGQELELWAGRVLVASRVEGVFERE